MRYLRYLLLLGVFGAAWMWALAARHGFTGAYCVDSGARCEGGDVIFPGYLVVWLAPLVVIVGILLYRRLGRRQRRNAYRLAKEELQYWELVRAPTQQDIARRKAADSNETPGQTDL